ncbi:MAG: carbamoyltransferase HypF [Chitinophagaceae bacterium]|nr:carbamoyltransferase HypF [Chitinophagaceae bacterium]
MEILHSILPSDANDYQDSSDELHWHIHFRGRVQGVGFRPYVYQKARVMGLTGAVSNGLDGVHIWLMAKEFQARSFYRQILDNPPPLSIISASSFAALMHDHDSGFRIILDERESSPDLWITPDFAMCPSCKSELEDPTDRRYRYPFITCTQCGPRYSVMNALPFERHLTTMEPFGFCATCRHEFNDPADRRFYAQTMSCPDCGVKMEWRDGNGNRIEASPEEIISSVKDAIQKGFIIAVKGIGGFLLMTDASNTSAIQRLRQRKHRPSKPFAIMYPGIESLQTDTTLSERQSVVLTSLEAPIVLIPISHKMKQSLAIAALAPGLDKLGIMLPYAPLLHLIAQSFGKPVVATSGNVSGAPICFTNGDALTSLYGIADFFLLHNRDIVTPQDDSVVSIAGGNAPDIILRRSRGYAPACEPYRTTSAKSILATGALMKSSFAMAHHQRVYVSQYLGNTDSYEAQQAYQHTLKHMQQLLRFEPEVILTDEHPLYFSHQLAMTIAEEKKLPLKKVQHHKAHFAAIMGECGPLEKNRNVLGIIWDGTGLGDDGNSWGGEFFTFAKNSIHRLNHFNYFPFLLGDKMAMEPRIAALSLLHTCRCHMNSIDQLFSKDEWSLYNRLLDDYNGIFTSSVGRLIDAASCLITGITKQSYEGEAAMSLEALANDWCRAYGWQMDESYLPGWYAEKNVPTAEIIKAVWEDVQMDADPARMAAKFHATLADIAGSVADRADAEDLCFSGGVFQNSVLVNMLIHRLQKRFKLHFHKYLSPNDENISFGQLVYFDRGIDG